MKHKIPRNIFQFILLLVMMLSFFPYYGIKLFAFIFPDSGLLNQTNFVLSFLFVAVCAILLFLKRKTKPYGIFLLAAYGSFWFILFGSVMAALFFGWIFFATMSKAIMTTLIALFFSVLTMIWGQPRKSACLISGISILSIAIFPLLMSGYTPAYSKDTDYEIRVARQGNIVENALKEVGRISEFTPCRHAFSGWNETHIFYYQRICDGKVEYWQYDPETDQASIRIATLPQNLYHPNVSYETLQRVLPFSFSPLYWPFKAFNFSPDGRWLAVLVNHFYGTEDIVFLTPKEDSDKKNFFPVPTISVEELVEESRISTTAACDKNAREKRDWALEILFPKGEYISECNSYCNSLKIIGNGWIETKKYLVGRAFCYQENGNKFEYEETKFIYTIYDDQYGILGTYPDLQAYRNSAASN